VNSPIGIMQDKARALAILGDLLGRRLANLFPRAFENAAVLGLDVAMRPVAGQRDG